MKKFYAFGGAAILACSSTFAQTENFTGLSSTLVLKRSDISYYADILGSASYSADIQASYGIALSKDVILNFGASFGMGSSKIANAPISEIFNYSSKLKNAASIYIEPGFLISNQTLIYSKISHETGKFLTSATTPIETITSSSTLQGLGLGVGVKTMINNKMFVQFEIKKVNYSTKNTMDDAFLSEIGNRYNATSGSVGIGYKF